MKYICLLCIFLFSFSANANQEPLKCPNVNSVHSTIICQRTGNNCNNPYDRAHPFTIDQFIKNNGFSVLFTRVDIIHIEDSIIFMCLEVK